LYQLPTESSFSYYVFLLPARKKIRPVITYSVFPDYLSYPLLPQPSLPPLSISLPQVPRDEDFDVSVSSCFELLPAAVSSYAARFWSRPKVPLPVSSHDLRFLNQLSSLLFHSPSFLLRRGMMAPSELGGPFASFFPLKSFFPDSFFFSVSLRIEHDAAPMANSYITCRQPFTFCFFVT